MHCEYLRMPLAERDHTMIYVEPAGTGGSGSLPDGARYDLRCCRRTSGDRQREAEFAPVVARVRCWPRPASDFAAVDLRGRIGSIEVPTLILAGARDVVFGLHAAAMLRAGVPGSRVAIS